MRTELKVCNACGEEKPLSEYYLRKDTGKPKGRCKACCIKGVKMQRSDTHKKCKHCGIEKPFSEFNTAGGGKWLQPYCKPCDSERKKKYVKDNETIVVTKRKKYRQENRDKINQRNLLSQKINKDKVNEYRRNRYQKKKDELLAYAKNLRAKKKKVVTVEEKEARKQLSKERKRKSRRGWGKRKMADIGFRLLKNVRSRIRCGMKGITKSDTTLSVLGCTIEFFKEYIESQFTDGMNWDNYGKFGWHLDHKIPVSWFDLSNPNCQKLAFHYTNQQPLWWEDNVKKQDKFHHPITQSN